MTTQKMENNEYAVIQYGLSIFGIGKTEEEAEKDARQWFNDPSDELNYSRVSNCFVGDMILVECSSKLAETVRLQGGDVPHTIVDGVAYLNSEQL